MPVLPLAHVVFSELVLKLLLAAEFNADLQQFLLSLGLNIELLGILGVIGSRQRAEEATLSPPECSHAHRADLILHQVVGILVRVQQLELRILIQPLRVVA